jgi:hypothetical protein
MANEKIERKMSDNSKKDRPSDLRLIFLSISPNSTSSASLNFIEFDSPN